MHSRWGKGGSSLTLCSRYARTETQKWPYLNKFMTAEPTPTLRYACVLVHNGQFLFRCPACFLRFVVVCLARQTLTYLFDVFVNVCLGTKPNSNQLNYKYQSISESGFYGDHFFPQNREDALKLGARGDLASLFVAAMPVPKDNNGHISTSLWRQKLSISASESICGNVSFQQ